MTLLKNTKPLTSMVYERLYGEIVNGTITSNDILTESALVQKMEVSKSPVREALILLCEENVLRAIPRIGYQVIQITPNQMAKLIEARMALEPFMLERAWSAIGEVQIAQLQHQVKMCKQDELINTSIRDNWRRNIEFHMLLGSFSGNDYLLESLNRALRACARAANQYFVNVRGIPQGDEDFHDRILYGIQSQDLELTMAALKEDIRQIV